MIRTSITKLPLCALLMFIYMICLTFAVGAVTVITQSPAGSEGWHIPEGAALETNPEAFNPAAIARGRTLYNAKCRRCHGSDGTGHGPEADPDHPPADLTDGRRASRKSRWRDVLQDLEWSCEAQNACDES